MYLAIAPAIAFREEVKATALHKDPPFGIIYSWHRWGPEQY